MTQPNHHYFASFGMGFKVAATRSGAIKGLVDGFRPDVKNIVRACHKDGQMGMPIWTCRVDAAINSEYRIEWFKPVGIHIADGKEHYVTYVSKNDVAYHTPLGNDFD